MHPLQVANCSTLCGSARKVIQGGKNVPQSQAQRGRTDLLVQPLLFLHDTPRTDGLGVHAKPRRTTPAEPVARWRIPAAAKDAAARRLPRPHSPPTFHAIGYPRTDKAERWCVVDNCVCGPGRAWDLTDWAVRYFSAPLEKKGILVLKETRETICIKSETPQKNVLNQKLLTYKAII